jgi:aspartate kinase
VENPLGGGTVIHPEPDIEAPHNNGPYEAPVVTLQTLSLANEEVRKNKRLPTAVTIKEGIVVLNVNSNRKSVSHGFFARIFGTLDRFGVVVDLISTSEVHVSMAAEDTLSRKTMERLLTELKKSGTVSSLDDNGPFIINPRRRLQSTVKWPSYPLSANRCTTWLVSQDACLLPSVRVM